MDIKRLQDKIRQDRTKANSLKADATRAEQAAAGFSGIGDTTRADTERNNADKFLQEIHALEQGIADAERQILALNQQLNDIDKQKSQIEDEAKRKLDDLDNQKTNITGTSSSLF